MLKVLCLQRESLVARGVPSLSVAARITEALDYLVDQKLLEFISIGENDAVATQAVHWADVLMMSKHNTESALALARTAKKLKKKIVYDLDDWIFSFPSYSGAQNKEIQASEIAKEIISLADVVSIANVTLQGAAKSVIGATVLVPNGMYIEKYFPGGKAVFPNQSSNRIVFTNADLLKIVVGKQNILSALQEFFVEKKDYILRGVFHTKGIFAFL
jgi:processive 1,2-diacylglycerol beta-glucosyltransferase